MRKVVAEMYNYGTEARELETETANSLKVRQANKVQSSQIYDERYRRAVEVLKKKAIRTLVIITAILTVIMIRQGQITALCGQSTKITNEINNLNALIMEKEMERSYQLDMNNIEMIAVSRLGMIKPSTAQYVYIDVQKNTGGEILVSDDAQGGFAAFVNKAKILLEYFY